MHYASSKDNNQAGAMDYTDNSQHPILFLSN
jgi:hypothetical protein